MIEAFPTENDHATRLKRAKMRAWRRGMREMDLILGGYIDLHGPNLDAAQLDAFEGILARRDQDLYAWLSGRDEDALRDVNAEELTLISDIRANWRSFAKN